MQIATQGCSGDAPLSILCRTRAGSSSPRVLYLESGGSDAGRVRPGPGWSLGPGGIQSLVPFIENSPQLTCFETEHIQNVDSRCFERLARTRCGRQWTLRRQ
jgi:hypothetical protein